MSWINIMALSPADAADCKVKTSLGRELDAVYYDCWGTFQIDTDDYPSGDMGWKDNGENPELVTHWKYSNIDKQNSHDDK